MIYLGTFCFYIQEGFLYSAGVVIRDEGILWGGLGLLWNWLVLFDVFVFIMNVGWCLI